MKIDIDLDQALIEKLMLEAYAKNMSFENYVEAVLTNHKKTHTAMNQLKRVSTYNKKYAENFKAKHGVPPSTWYRKKKKR